MNEGIAFSLLLGLMWNLMQFEKTCHTSNWIARVFMYSRRRMARQTCPKSMGFVTIFEYNVTSYFKVVSVGGCKEVVAMRYFPVKKETEDNIIVHIPRDAAMILAD